MSKTMQLAENDVEALTRAIQMTLEGNDRDEAERIERYLIEDGWLSAAESAAHTQQYKALSLSPWECPPCEFAEDSNPDNAHEGRPCDRASIVLLRRMLAHGLSKWEPSPLDAINAKRKLNVTRR